jgi:predicted nuclease of predicted toxin-antitoxin system
VKFKLDENLPISSAQALAGCGHEVDTVAAEGLTGAADPRVVAAAAAEARVLITLDRGMGDIRAYPPGSHAGIVVLRLHDQSAPAVRNPVPQGQRPCTAVKYSNAAARCTPSQPGCGSAARRGLLA